MKIEHKEEINITHSNKINCSLTRAEAEELYEKLANVLGKNTATITWPNPQYDPPNPWLNQPYCIGGNGSLTVTEAQTTKISGPTNIGGISSEVVRVPGNFPKTLE